MEERVCQNSQLQIESIEDDIKICIPNKDYYREKGVQVHKFLEETVALKNFIAGFGNSTGTHIPTIKEFKIANLRVNSKVVYVSQKLILHKYFESSN